MSNFNKNKYQAPSRGPETLRSLSRLANLSQHLSIELLGPLLQAVGDGPLPGRRALCKGSAATKGPGSSPVADAHNADIVDPGDGRLARHASRHLHAQGEVLVGGQAQPLEANARDILGHLGRLERGSVRPTRRAVDGSREGTSPVLVDLRVPVSQHIAQSKRVSQTHLVEHHLNTPVIPARRQPGLGALTGGGSNISLRLDGARRAAGTEQALEELPGDLHRRVP